MTTGNLLHARLTVATAAIVCSTALACVPAIVIPSAVNGEAPGRLSEPEVRFDVQYYSGPGASAEHHSLDLYLPGAGGSYPVVLFLHGGGWRDGDKNEVPGVWYANVGRALAAEGIGVALVNYRLTDGSADSVSHPGHIRDVARAFSFVRALLVTEGRDPSNIFLAGHEAGAHLAALAALNGRFLSEHGLSTSQVRGVVALSGVYRIDPGGTADADVFGTDPEVRRDASPIDHVSTAAPPFDLLYAEADLSGRDEEARALADALTAVGGVAESHQIADRTHFSIVRSIGSPDDETTAQIVDFVLSRRQLTPTPTATGTRTPSPTSTVTPTPTATPASVHPPSQAPDGPGGAARPHSGAREWEEGGDAPYSLLLPADPIPGEAPVVVFVGSPSESGTGAYRSWLLHLVHGGAAVIVPTGYMECDPTEWTEAAGEAVRAAIAALQAVSSTRVRTELLAFAGHEEGASVAAGLAASWFDGKLPEPRAVLLIAPRQASGIVGEDLGRLPNDVRVLFVAIEEDDRYDNDSELLLWDGMRHVTGAWRQRLVLRSDRYGIPPLVADRSAPLTDGPRGRLDALDWYGTWKWLDALLACAFYDRYCEYAFGNTVAQRGMGSWSDGRPVREALYTDGPPRADEARAYFPYVRRW